MSASSSIPETAHNPAARSIREVVFGVNDGLVSITGVVVGVTSSHMARHEIVIAGLAAMVAATVSMGLGAYLSTQAQREYFQSEWDREMQEVHEVPDEERREVEGIMRQKGFTPDEAQHFTARLMMDKQQWVDFMMKEELGIMVEAAEHPWLDAGVMAFSVVVGALPPILPFLFAISTQSALLWAIALAILVAFGLGVLKAVVAKGNWLRSGLQFLLVTSAAVVVGVVVGRALGGIASTVG